MALLAESNPSIRAAHFFKFSKDRDASDHDRVGYTYAFHLFHSGQGALKLDQRLYTIKPGTLMFIAPQVKHSILCDPGNPLTCYNIYCDLWNDADMSDYPHLRLQDQIQDKFITTIKPCKQLDQFPLVCSLNGQPFLMDLFAHIVQVYERQENNAGYEITKGLLIGWLLEVLQHAQSKEPFDYRIQKVLELIDKRAGEEDFEEWLLKSGLNRSHFYHQFKKATGVTPKMYVLKVKMKHAAMALIESKASITSISESLGYATIHYFTNQFRKYYGESPTSYRKKGIYRLK